LAAGLALAQAAGFVAFGVVLVVQAARGDRSSVVNVGLLIGLLLGWAAALGFAARGLRRRQRWSRTPLVVSQVLLLAVGVPLVQGSSARWEGIALVTSSAVALLALLSRAVTAELET
jgi:hypothetical protein